MRTQVFVVVFAVAVVAAVASPGLRATPKRDAAWDALSAAEKSDQIWTSVTADETSWPWPSFLKVGTILLENMNPTFDTVSDVLPPGREKLIHSVGRVGKFVYVPTDNNTYTGGFGGSTYGICRFSFALEPKSSGIIPGTAWKFLRDGVPSGDFMAMTNIAAQSSFDYFANVVTNHLPQFTGVLGKLIGHKFTQASSCIRAVGLSNVAMYDQDGTQVEDFSSPFQVFMVPQLHFPDSSSNLDNWDALFASIPPGTMLYEVHAIRNPDSAPEIIGHIYSNSAIVPSNYGDTHLFFEHQRMTGPTGDFAYNPQWAEHGLNIPDMCEDSILP